MIVNKQELRKEFDDLKGLNYFYYKDIRDVRGKKIGTQSFSTVKTKNEEIPLDEWYDRIRNLAKKYDEEYVIEQLKRYIKITFGWCFEKVGEDLEIEALRFYFSRHWDESMDDTWIKFRENYLSKVEIIKLRL